MHTATSQFALRQTFGHPWTKIFWASAAVILSLFLRPHADAQSLETSNAVRTIQIGSLGSGASAEAIRQRLIDRLKKSGHLEIIESAPSADIVVRGTSSIWRTGTISPNPRSNSVSMTNYEGYLSVEAVGKSGQPLWSYLVTPSRFRMDSITNDLADQIASRLLNAIHSGIAGSASAVATRAAAGVHLRAAGSTFAAPLYLKWIESSGMSISYDAIGSEAGIQQLKAGAVDFAASDMPLKDGDTLAQLNLMQFPTVVGGLVPIYNLAGLHGNLRLTPQLLAGIYLGTIRRWNDPRIREVNHGIHLPNADIAVIHRAEGSGTTFVWTSYLSQVSAEWKDSVGSGPRVRWPTGDGAAGNEGVAEMVQKTPNAIGYVELIYAIQHQLNYAAVRNAAGEFVKADLASIAAAASSAGKSAEKFAPLSILNAPNKDAYPISTFTWLLVPTQSSDPQKKAAIAQLLSWMMTAGQKECASLGYVPLPHAVAIHELQRISAIK